MSYSEADSWAPVVVVVVVGMTYSAQSDIIPQIERIIADRGGKREAGEIRFRCPHPDQHRNSDGHPSARWNPSKAAWTCDVCGAGGGYMSLARALGIAEPRGRGRPIPWRARATAQRRGGCTLAQYAEARRLPLDFLRGLGLSDVAYCGASAVRIPYLDTDGTERAVQFRLALQKRDGVDRFKWRRGSKPCPYGLNRLKQARDAGCIVVVEGASDSHTLWFHRFPALGLPSGTWREDWATYLDGIGTIYVNIERDGGGEALRKRLDTSKIRERVRLLDLGEAKDPSALYLAHPEDFRQRFENALKAAVPWSEQAQRDGATAAAAAWRQCAALSREADILAAFVEDLAACGVVGEVRTTKLIYLAVTSRLLKRVISVAVKGPSSAGKSYLIEQVLRFFPASAYYTLSAMSERALAYSQEPLAHRMLVIYEAAGLRSDFASYLVRSLLSEGRVRYETVEKTRDGLQPRLIEREGPTGLLVTTTSVRLHPENETRLMSVTVTDSQEQTAQVMRATANDTTAAADFTRWHALQEWLARAEHRVIIPYARALADLIPPVAVRLRRDFGALLNLIRAHALLHEATRARNKDGRVVATLDDYIIVRELVADLVADSLEATVSEAVRETVQAVTQLVITTNPVSMSAVARYLKLDRATASRRVGQAVDRGYLRNEETRKGHPAKLTLGDPLPQEQEILPLPERVADCCAVARATEEIVRPPSPCRVEVEEGAVS